MKLSKPRLHRALQVDMFYYARLAEWAATSGNVNENHKQPLRA